MTEQDMTYSGKRTRQKEIIYQELKRLDHPSATAVYESVRRENPTLSRATVFRVLSNFAKEGYIRKLEFSDTDVRYDYRTEEHYHCRCKRCGGVSDCFLPYLTDLEKLATLPEGFQVEGHEIQFVGICADCAKK